MPEGAYNIRANGHLASRQTTANISIESKTDVSGIDIRIKPGTVNESVHIPVVLSESGLKEMVYNDFYIGEGSDVQEGCSLHVDAGFPLTVGRNVIIGHNATVHGCTVEDGVLIGMGAIVMNGVHVGKEALIGAGALVPEGREVPPRAVMVGVPAKQIRTLTDEEVAQNAADAALYVEIGKQMERDGIAAAGANMPRNIPAIGIE